jgi:hypothetical protein
MEEIRELPKSFVARGECRGFEFAQIADSKHGFIYEVTFDGSRHYEVFKKRVVQTFTINEEGERIVTGKKYSYPTSKAFGDWAWTATSFASAIARLDKIEDNGESKRLREQN